MGQRPAPVSPPGVPPRRRAGGRGPWWYRNCSQLGVRPPAWRAPLRGPVACAGSFTRPGRGRRAAGRRLGCGVGRAGEGRAAPHGRRLRKGTTSSSGKLRMKRIMRRLQSIDAPIMISLTPPGGGPAYPRRCSPPGRRRDEPCVDAARAQDHTASEGCRAAWPGDYGAQCLRVCLWFKLIDTECLTPLVNAPCAAPCTRKQCRVTTLPPGLMRDTRLYME